MGNTIRKLAKSILSRHRSMQNASGSVPDGAEYWWPTYAVSVGCIDLIAENVVKLLSVKVR